MCFEPVVLNSPTALWLMNVAKLLDAGLANQGLPN
jgi:hypothetical protein